MPPAARGRAPVWHVDAATAPVGRRLGCAGGHRLRRHRLLTQSPLRRRPAQGSSRELGGTGGRARDGAGAYRGLARLAGSAGRAGAGATRAAGQRHATTLRWVLGGSSAGESFLLSTCPATPPRSSGAARTARSPPPCACTRAWGRACLDRLRRQHRPGAGGAGPGGLVLWSRGRTPAQWLQPLRPVPAEAGAGVLWLAGV